jgi:hypothetical protein
MPCSGSTTGDSVLDINTKHKLYAKLYKWARKKYRGTYMELYRYDSKCTNCEQWNSIITLDYENFVLETNFGFMKRCGCCKKTTFWNCDVAIMPMPCDAKGTPVPDKGTPLQDK